MLKTMSPRSPAAVRRCDLIWTVLTAATDLQDAPMMRIAHRAADDLVNGRTPAQADVDVIGAYFR